MAERTQSILSESLSPVRIEFGRIINVDYDRRTVDFRSEFSERFSYDIPWGYPFFDQIGGSGITFIPEPGQTCFCLFPSDSKIKPIILCFLGAHEEGSYLCGQQKGNPGDILINGRDGNFLAVKRGGIIQIGAKPICQTLYFPIRNIIRHISENHEILTVAGELNFEVLRTEDSSDGKSKCIFDVSVREFAEDDKDLIKLSMGALDNNNTFILESRDKSGGNIKVSLTMNKSGEVNWTIEGKLVISSKNEVKISSGTDISIKAKSNLELISESGSFKLDGPSGKIHTTGQLDIAADASLSIKSPNITINNGVFAVVRNSPDLIAFFAAVSTALNTLAPGSCVLPTQYSNQTVKV